MLRNKNGQIRSGWLIIVGFLALYIGQTIFSIPGTLALIMEHMDDQGAFSISQNELYADPWLSALMLGGSAAGGIIATWLLWRFLFKRKLADMGFAGKWKDLIFGLLLGVFSVTVIAGILIGTGQAQFAEPLGKPDFSWFALSFLIVFILVGISEEMFFRGYVMCLMEERGNSREMIYFISAIVFSFAHIMNPNVNAIGILNIMLVGILLAYMFERTQSLMLPIGYHIAWNYAQGNIFGFPVSGTEPHGIYRVETSGGNAILTGGAFGLEGGLAATCIILASLFVVRVFVRKTYAKS